VEIPKASGGTRPLGSPTVADRVARTVVKMVLEPAVEPLSPPPPPRPPPPPGPQWYRVSFGSHRASDLPVLTKEHVLATFPAIGTIADARLRSLSVDVWRYVSDRNPAWSDIERVPLHPTMPIATHGNLVKHIVGMVR